MFSILDNSKRYYPSPTEQAILINGTRYYFSQPERSPKRNIITKKYSNEFSPFNPHWNHRAVRLWFNNNKSLYIANNNNNILANTKLQQITISLKEKIVSNNTDCPRKIFSFFYIKCHFFFFLRYKSSTYSNRNFF